MNSKLFFLLTVWMWNFGDTISAQCGALYQQDVKNQLVNWGANLISNGYEITHDVKFLTLYQGNWDNFTLTLSSGNTYRITAGCDRDCNDLDLKIYDQNGNLVAEDVDSDDRPLLSVTPRWTGQFTLYVRAYRCTKPPCCIGIAVFGK